MSKKYTDEEIALAVKNSISINDVLRKLGAPTSGSMHSHISRRVKLAGLDTSHFDPYTHNRGSLKRTKAVIHHSERLVNDQSRTLRMKSYLLRKAFLSYGTKYVCSCCGIDKWQGESIQLDIDHINGDWKDNRPENLRFLCPNCHSQTPTWKNKTRQDS